MKIKNLSGKVIGIGDLILLPGKTDTLPVDMESNPVVKKYEEQKLVKLTGEKSGYASESEPEKPISHIQEQEADESTMKSAKAFYENFDNQTYEDIVSMAAFLGLDPSAMKDEADVKKKVKSALKKAIA